MAYDAFLWIEGVEGESQKEGHAGQIDLQSFAWGADNPSTMGGGTGSGAGKGTAHNFTVVKATDKSSPVLFTKCMDGTTFAMAQVGMQKAAGDCPIEYLKYRFANVFVTAVQWSGSGGGDNEDVPQESVSFSFGFCSIEYTPQNDDGTPGIPVHGGWDVGRNTKY